LIAPGFPPANQQKQEEMGGGLPSGLEDSDDEIPGAPDSGEENVSE